MSEIGVAQQTLIVGVLQPGGIVTLSGTDYQNIGEHDVYLGFFSLMEDPIPIYNITDDPIPYDKH